VKVVVYPLLAIVHRFRLVGTERIVGCVGEYVAPRETDRFSIFDIRNNDMRGNTAEPPAIIGIPIPDSVLSASIALLMSFIY